MMKRLLAHPRLRGLLLFLSVAGPGIITSNVDNDAGGIATYSMAGAHFGYSLLWSLIPIMVALIIVQEMSSRMGVVTGKGLSDLIRERFGVKITVYLMFALVLTNFGNVIAEFAGVASSLEIFHVSKYISVPLAAVIVWLLVVKGTYRTVEKVFLSACIFYVTYIVAGFLAKPDWAAVGGDILTPSFKMSSESLGMIIGLVGTTIAPWMQFYLQAAIVEKNVSVKEYKMSRLDVIIGSVVVTVVAGFIVLTCAATLFKAGVRVETAADAAQALRPLAGRYCAALFAFGLLNASLFAASILPLVHGLRRLRGHGLGKRGGQEILRGPAILRAVHDAHPARRGHRPAAPDPALPGHVHFPGPERHGPASPARLHDPAHQQQETDGRACQRPGLQHHLLGHRRRPGRAERRLYRIPFEDMRPA